MNAGDKVQCIYCQTEFQWESRMRGDHVIPASFGKFVKPLFFQRICKNCNKALNRWENVLLHHTICTFHLTNLNPPMENTARESQHKRGERKQMSYEELEPVRAYFNHGDTLEEYTPDVNKTGKTKNLAIVQDENGVDVTIYLFEGMTAESLQKKIKPTYDLSKIKFYTDSDKTDYFANLFIELIPGCKLELLHEWDRGWIRDRDVVVAAPATDKFYPALAKIGFHYFLSQFDGLFTGAEDRFASIRKFIFDGGENYPEFFQFADTVNKAKIAKHRLTARYQNGESNAIISLFAGMDQNDRHYKIAFSPDAKESKSLFLEAAHHYVYHCENGKRDPGTIERPPSSILGIIV